MKEHDVLDPNGLGNMTISYGISKGNVVRSSLVWNLQKPGANFDSVMTQSMMTGSFEHFGEGKVGGDLNGLFNIPIAVCNSGECISHHEHHDRNCPCIVGGKYHNLVASKLSLERRVYGGE